MTESEIVELKKQIALLKKGNEVLNKKLKASEGLKTHFISNIMNEIYNPFTSILMMSENIINLDKEKLDQAYAMANLIHSEAAKLDFHLKNIFAAAMIEAGLDDVDCKSTDIQKLLDSVIRTFASSLKNKNIKIENTSINRNLAEVNTDKNKISLIFSNLISNAIKFSNDSGIIEVEIKEDNSNLTFTIKDSGPGITDNHKDEIFDRFERLDDTINSITGGNGLGLSIVKAYVELLNGTIEIKNTKGTKITIVIPVCTAEEADDDLFDDEELF
ncbi:MAG: HAMP domain-containing histidine kinase [Chlorobi bacterium]|nr:HAMP domain-containing histidine kinase [Chlorobiota bacterium]